MAKKEVKTDLWVASMLKDQGFEYDAQGSSVKEIDEALKTASKRGTGMLGSRNLFLLLATSLL